MDIKVLIVEDDPGYASYLKSLVMRMGYELCEMVGSGDEAIVAVRQGEPDLLLMDIDIPGIADGIETARSILAENDVAILFMTGFHTGELFQRALEVSPYGYLVKPIKKEDLYLSIETTLRLHDEQRKIRLERERFRTVSSLTSDYCYSMIVNRDGTLLPEWEFGSFERVTGYTPEELYEKGGIGALIHPEDMPEAEKRVQRQLQGKTITSDLRIITKSGGTRWIRDTGYPQLDRYENRVIRIYGSARDVTTTRKTLESMKKSEAFSRAIADTTPSLVYIYDLEEERNIWTNRAHREILGETTVNQETLAGMVHGEDFSQLVERLERLKNSPSGAWEEVEFRMKGSDGRWYWLYDRASVFMRKETGEVKQILGSMINITDRKETEESLRDNERFLSSVFNNIQDGLCVMDREHNVLRINQWMKREFRVKGPLNGKKCHHTFMGREQECPSCPAGEAMKSGEPETGYMPLPDAENPDKWYLVTAFPLKDEECNVTGVIEHVRDITDEKRNEDRLRESERKLLEAHRLARLGSFEVDVPGGNLRGSEVFFTIFGVDQDEHYTWNDLKKLVHPEDYSSILKTYTHTLEEEDSFNIDFRGIHQVTGETVYLNTRGGMEYDAAGNPVRLMATVADITDRKKLEESLRTARIEAETANRAKSTFLANMSHELRTPLNAIIGFGQLIESEDDPANLKEYVSLIRESGEHLLEMVNDILDLSRIESQKVELHREYFNLHTMLSRSPSTVRSIAARKGIHMELNIQGDIGWLYGDEVRIKQVVYNLISNAIKFTEAGKRVGIDARASDDWAVITVWDQGVGIPPGELERIFDPFEQVNGGRKDKPPGTGLGLAISRNLVEMHGGKLTVESREGEGSRFTLELPGRVESRKEEVEPEEPVVAVSTQKKKGRVLVVDDDRTNLHLMKNILEKRGFKVVLLEDGSGVTRRLKQEPFDCVFMDIQMPGKDGIEALQEIRKENMAVPVVALTAYAMKGDREKFLDYGFSSYISKPVQIQSLYSILDEFSCSGGVSKPG